MLSINNTHEGRLLHQGEADKWKELSVKKNNKGNPIQEKVKRHFCKLLSRGTTPLKLFN